MRALRRCLIFAAAVPVAGCNLSTACTLDSRPGIVVEVRDAVTAAAIADGARLIVRDGDYVETVEGPPIAGLPYLEAARERPGMYDVTVQKAGYEEWTRSRIWARDGGCHVSTVRLQATLQPTG
jgi:hypothetical protein